MLYKFRDSDQATKLLLTNELWFSDPRAFNDPYDCALQLFFDQLETENHCHNYILQDVAEIAYSIDKHLGFDTKKTSKILNTILAAKSKKNSEFGEELASAVDSKKFQKLFQFLRRLEHFNRIGVLSLSKSLNHPLMWAHYSDSHKGVAIGFKDNVAKTIKYKPGLDSEINKIKCKYVNSLKSKINNKSYEINKKRIAHQLISLKSKHWQYEKEVRLINFSANGAHSFDKKAISEIVFGCKCTGAARKAIEEICRGKNYQHVNLRQATVAPGKFSIFIQKLEVSKNTA